MRKIVHIYFSVVAYIACLNFLATMSAAKRGSCINRITLLSNLVRNDNRINASTSVEGYPPWNVTMSCDGWCSVSLPSMCKANISRAMDQYLLVNFGAEAVVEAIGTAAASNGNYLERYMVEYARSDGQFFTVTGEDGMLFEGNSACTQTEQVQQFGTPVIAQYIRIVPAQWVGPMVCFRMELYGCFVRECPEVDNLSDNRTLLPDDNVYESSTYTAIIGTRNDVREAWCAQGTDNTPNVILTFTQPLYITYATTRGVSIYWLREYSYYTVGSSGRSLYTDVDGISVYGQSDNGLYTVPFWEPIEASVVELRIDDYVPVFPCVGIKLYGCVYSEAVDHSILLSPTTSVNADPIISTSTTFTSTMVMGTTQVTPNETCACPSTQGAITTTVNADQTLSTSLNELVSSSTSATPAEPTVTYASSPAAVATSLNATSTSVTFSDVIISSSVSTTLAEPTAACATSQPAAFITVIITVTSTVYATQSQSTTLRTSPSSTVTVTKTLSAQCPTITISPSAVQCSEQQLQTTKDSDNSCNAIAICIPVAVVIGLVVCVIVLITIWRVRHKAVYDCATSNLPMSKIYDDLYGTNGPSENGTQADRKDSVKYECPKTVIRPMNQPTPVTYETVSLHERDGYERTAKKTSNVAGPVYSLNTHDDVRLQHNPAYEDMRLQHNPAYEDMRLQHNPAYEDMRLQHNPAYLQLIPSKTTDQS